MILVDSNILIDIFTNDPAWADWSEGELIKAVRYDTAGINPLIYAEVSVAFQTEEKLQNSLLPLGLHAWTLPFEAAFLAGKAFLKYRKKGGGKTSPLPDFYIGAHAVSQNYKLLTRDPKRFQYYFPSIKLVTP